MTTPQGAVLLRLEGPMQSWGNRARGANNAHRTTHTRPTKSGVIGMVANALGRDFSDDIDDLAMMKFGVRADVLGRLEVDYHTTGAGAFPVLPGEVYRNRKWFSRDRLDQMVLHEDEYVAPIDVTHDVSTETVFSAPGKTVVTHDWYLADASFLAVLVGSWIVVDDIAEALACPRRPMYLGRRAYLPSEPVLVGTATVSDTISALRFFPRSARTPTGPVPAWIEPPNPEHANSVAVPVSDQPISFGGPVARAARLELAVSVDPPAAPRGARAPTSSGR
jgi:CRISPR system Cascade subunit CasD